MSLSDSCLRLLNQTLRRLFDNSIVHVRRPLSTWTAANGSASRASAIRPGVLRGIREEETVVKMATASAALASKEASAIAARKATTTSNVAALVSCVCYRRR